MRFAPSACLVLGGLLVAIPLTSQTANLGRPTEMTVQKHDTPEEIRDRAGNLQFQKDIKELSELCASVPHDMEALKQGVLSKDTIERLKRMKKLSKHVREQLTRN